MGLLILPFILAAFVITLIAIILTVRLTIKKQIGGKAFFFGVVTSLVFYGFLILCYKISGSAWALSPGFIMPIGLSIIPFGLYLILKSQNNKSFALTLLISVMVSGVCMIVFYKAYFDFFDYIGIEKVY